VLAPISRRFDRSITLPVIPQDLICTDDHQAELSIGFLFFIRKNRQSKAGRPKVPRSQSSPPLVSGTIADHPSERARSRDQRRLRARELKRRVERHYDGIPRCAVSPPHRVSAEPSSGACAPCTDDGVTHARRAFIMLLRVNKIDALFSAR